MEAFTIDITARTFGWIANVQLHKAVVVCDNGDTNTDYGTLLIGTYDLSVVIEFSPLQMMLLLTDLITAYTCAPTKVFVEWFENGPTTLSTCSSNLRALTGTRGDVLVTGREMHVVVDLSGRVHDASYLYVAIKGTALVWIIHEPMSSNERWEREGEDEKC